MKPESALILLLAVASALPARALRLEPQPNPTGRPLPVVDIEDAAHTVVAQLFVLPGETMKLDTDTQVPASGAGYYKAMPGEDYQVIIPAKFEFPLMGKEGCPCALHMDKIGWNRQGAVTIVTGLRPFLETSSGAKIAIVSDVKHPRIANGRLYFKLQGRSSQFWVLTRFGQVEETGGPWGLRELVHFFFAVLLPLALVAILGYTLAGAILLFREDSHPEKSFLQLMLLSFMRLPVARKMNSDSTIPSIRGE